MWRARSSNRIRNWPPWSVRTVAVTRLTRAAVSASQISASQISAECATTPASDPITDSEICAVHDSNTFS